MTRKVTKRWRTRDGTLIRICDMTDAHLSNAIRFLRRSAKMERDVSLRETEALAQFITGEEASWDIEQNVDALSDDAEGSNFLPEIYDRLVEEAERRGIYAQLEQEAGRD